MQQVLAVAMRIGDDDLGRAGRLRGFDGGERLARHELAKAAVLEAGWAELIAGHGAGDALHVDRDVDLELARLLLECGTRGQSEQRKGSGLEGNGAHYLPDV